jgi:hypothetical protein
MKLMQIKQLGLLSVQGRCLLQKFYKCLPCKLNSPIVDKFLGFDCPEVVLRFRSSSKGFHFLNKFVCW